MNGQTFSQKPCKREIKTKSQTKATKEVVVQMVVACAQHCGLDHDGYMVSLSRFCSDRGPFLTVWKNHMYTCAYLVKSLKVKKNIFKLKQSWLLAFWKIRSKTHKRLKTHFLIGRNRTKCANFLGSPLFQAMYNIKTEKQLIQLILCQLDVGGWRKEKGTRLTSC